MKVKVNKKFIFLPSFFFILSNLEEYNMNKKKNGIAKNALKKAKKKSFN
jgi:hypothetical protein